MRIFESSVRPREKVLFDLATTDFLQILISTSLTKYSLRILVRSYPEESGDSTISSRKILNQFFGGGGGGGFGGGGGGSGGGGLFFSSLRFSRSLHPGVEHRTLRALTHASCSARTSSSFTLSFLHVSSASCTRKRPPKAVAQHIMAMRMPSVAFAVGRILSVAPRISRRA